MYRFARKISQISPSHSTRPILGREHLPQISPHHCSAPWPLQCLPPKT